MYKYVLAKGEEPDLCEVTFVSLDPLENWHTVVRQALCKLPDTEDFELDQLINQIESNNPHLVSCSRPASYYCNVDLLHLSPLDETEV